MVVVVMVMMMMMMMTVDVGMMMMMMMVVVDDVGWGERGERRPRHGRMQWRGGGGSGCGQRRGGGGGSSTWCRQKQPFFPNERERESRECWESRLCGESDERRV